MRITFIILFLLIMGQIPFYAQLSNDLINRIEQTERLYSRRKQFDEARLIRINELKEQLLNSGSFGELEQQYNLYKQLYKECFSFKSHDAFNAAMRMEQLADQLHADKKSVEATLCKAEILLCSGLFNETIELLSTIKEVPDTGLKADYYRVMTRLYGDLKTYNDVPLFKKKYEQLNHQYADSLLGCLDTDDVNYQMVKALSQIDRGNAQQALEQCRTYLSASVLSEHQKAMIYSCMAWGAEKMGDTEGQIAYLLQSIESDIRSSTYETTSGRVLAQVLLANGEIELAHQFVLRAIEDAEFYGARQRKAEITHIVPIIETQLKELQRFKVRAVTGIFLLVLISLVVILFLWIRLMKRHKEVKAGQEKINEQNALLSKRNDQLLESNKIKEEYLTNYFELSSVYFHEMEKMQDKIKSLLVQKKYTAIADLIRKSGPKEDKERLYARFDTLFLNLFPTFIEAVNKVLDEPELVSAEDVTGRLTAELRVFALYRLGITGADRIASILGVSRNTVYTYRNRIKTKVKMEPDVFDRYVMEIPAY